ncbi:hypothetical protein A2415_02340 [candidate division WWE3 bacterium RIFOXYC1_FULL_39_7]|uniref:Soluble ligand binding domain-containing protein n=2 Tax=Katanobacteria TaxID=422282 RepID=A0A1F4X5W6_UNCKA|nr:MAG: hypothetical protein A2415_02340 [candidate division WWE3 bacterium RIFOXYC1_FULL_39_7]OGC77056.1 MAG: hypothetical protein A2619_01515 [candidate division WWE3 bacterium RIFOXYD1_FULL_39_9]
MLELLNSKKLIIVALLTVFVVGAAFYLQSNFLNESSVSVESLGDVVIEEGSSDEYVYVDISGAVQKPGVYKLPINSLVVDLINDAGGFETSSSVTWVAKNLNLARKLEDADKIYIPFLWEDLEKVVGQVDKSSDSSVSAVSAETSNYSEKLNINKSTKEQLMELPGVGETYSDKILQNMPYKTIDDFRERSGLSEKVIDKFVELIVIE